LVLEGFSVEGVLTISIIVLREIEEEDSLWHSKRSRPKKREKDRAAEDSDTEDRLKSEHQVKATASRGGSFY
jgi:hypothetical protein